MTLPSPLPEALNIMRTVSVFGAARIEQQIEKLTTGEQNALAAQVGATDSQAGGYTIFGTSLSYWANPARAWMVLELQGMRAFTTNPPSFNGLTAQELQGLVNTAAGMSAQELLDSVADRLSGRKIIAAMAAAQSDPVRQRALLTWAPANFSDPKSHRPQNFTYLIHGLRRRTGIGLASAPPARRDWVNLNLSAYIDDTTLDLKSGQYYLENTDILAKSLLSCSVVTHDKIKTYADMYFGFILHVPVDNIGAASSTDMDMGFDKATRPDMLAVEPDKRVRIAIITDSFVQGVATLFARPLPTLNELVTQTSVDSHNEVPVIGTMGGSVATVCGLFLKVTKQGSMLPPEFDVDQKEWQIRNVLLACADRQKIPIVMLPDPNLAAGSSWFAALFGAS